jgi:Fic family protein
MRTTLIKSTYLDHYKKKQPVTLIKHLNKLKELEFDKNAFGYSFSMASVYSSMIEGNNIDFDTYLSYSASGMNTKSKSFMEIEDLIHAYRYALKTELSIDSALKAHHHLSKTIIKDSRYRGKVRDKNVYVFSGSEMVYAGAPANIVKEEVNTLFEDIAILMQREMTTSEIFYFASMIHLVFVKIHPFADGNGRSARLLEKWFMAEKLGQKAWFIPSEKLYQVRRQSYYKNVNLGPDYAHNNFDLCIPFLKMLPMALTMKK